MNNGIKDLETLRIGKQRILDTAKSQLERNRLGQFATPYSLALGIVSYSLRLLGPTKLVKFLDPAFGTGAFYSALLALAGNKRIRASGFEIDPRFVSVAKGLWNDSGLKLRGGDFTKACPDMQVSNVNLLVCNPPYVRHHHLHSAEKIRLRDLVTLIGGSRLSGLCGLYGYFLMLSHAWLEKNAVSAWLIPSEFMDVNYGRELKSYLLKNVSLIRIHRFNPNEVQFDDALVSSAVVWFRNSPPGIGHKTEFTFGGTIEKPHVSAHIASSILNDAEKWSRFPMSSTYLRHDRPKLEDFFTIKRGIATGSNSFFVLKAPAIEQMRIPQEVLKPILPSPRNMPLTEILADRKGLPQNIERLFLIDCSLPEDDVKRKYPSLWRYLQTGKERGVDKGYLCTKRKPWYSQERRSPPMFLCTYMGRMNAARDSSPFRFILNHSAAVATNVYLLLYPKDVVKNALLTDRGLSRQIWQQLNAISIQELVDGGRVYGGGLHKLEPKELGSIAAPEILIKRSGNAVLIHSC